jgi:ketosteroid isomerase-like protein
VNEAANIRTVRALFACFGQGDIAGAVSLMTDDVEWHVEGRPEVVPWAGMRRGREQVARFFTILSETVELQQLEPSELIARDDAVVVLGRELSRVKSTDRVCHSAWAMVFSLRNGQIARFHEYHDTGAWAAAYGEPVVERHE